MSTDALTARLDRAGTTRATIEPGQQTAAKIVGVLYLFQMATAIFGQSYVRDQLIVRGDATRTAENIVGAERLWSGAWLLIKGIQAPIFEERSRP